MPVSILLALIILACAACLALLLYPRETTEKVQRWTLKRKPLPPSPTRPSSPGTEKAAPAGADRDAGKPMQEMEAIRTAVQTFAGEDPSTTARILKKWMKNK